MKKLITNSKYEFRTNYYADDNGHIWSEYKQDYLTEYPDKDGYMKVVLMTKDKPAGKGHRFSVHRLILHTFNPIENENYYQVDHIDGNKTNNTLQNLKWVSCLENLNNPNTKPNRRVYDQAGTHNAMSKFTEESLMNMIQDINSGNYTQNEIIIEYNTSREAIRRIIHKQTYISELKDIPSLILQVLHLSVFLYILLSFCQMFDIKLFQQSVFHVEYRRNNFGKNYNQKQFEKQKKL